VGLEWLHLWLGVYLSSFQYSSINAVGTMQLVDFTTLMAVAAELRRDWLPARLEQVYQRDRHTINLCLRTLDRRGWLTVAWHPQAARLCLADPPPKTPDTFTFSQQLWHQLNGLALVDFALLAPWERVIDCQFARRPGDPIQWHLYIEVMGKYSNVILTNQDHVIVTAAHQVSAQQSRLRPIQTGQVYTPPPALTDAIPSLQESQQQWQERIALIPGAIGRNLQQTYRGLSTPLIKTLLAQAELQPTDFSDQLQTPDWQSLFQTWQVWLTQLETASFQPGWLPDGGYTVLGWATQEPATSVAGLLHNYYSNTLNHQEFSQLRQQLLQKLNALLTKLKQKAAGFQQRLQESDQAETYREQADLLMAHLHLGQPGMNRITLADFSTGTPVTITLEPDKTLVQNAQGLYKKHQKLKRARGNVEPLLAAVNTEIAYLSEVEAATRQCEAYTTSADLEILSEIRDELVQQQYLSIPDYRSSAPQQTNFYRYKTPNGWELWVGRNNRQNDELTFRLASPYDLWFHSQEIPGSHLLMRLEAGAKPQTTDLQFAANLAAYYSQARHSHQVPVVYTEPRHLYKPKGAKPGWVVYKQEQIIWGQPQVAAAVVGQLPAPER
jgi:predicted ribosome quality control (RQC) complex YloA/Tae2 family protein